MDHDSGSHRGTSTSSGLTQDWDTMVQVARDTILRTIEARLKINLSAHIIDEEINTPTTWKTKFNLDRGAILGLSHSFFNVLSFRPKTKHPSIQDLYFVGASTHPGTGVPIVLAGAKLVTQQIIDDLGLKKWLSGSADKGGKKHVSSLDVEHKFTFLRMLQWVTIALCLLWMSMSLQAQYSRGSWGLHIL